MELLSVQNLKKNFKAVKAVDGISFQVKKGEILGLLGPNGAGKSTTISMISTFLKPTDGDITYKNISILKKPKIIKERLGYVPQEIAIYPTLTGKENLEFWGRAYGIKGKLLKDRIIIISKIIGIKDRLKDKVENYSGGMKRRLNIGVALLHKPELIIMDEPTVGIDPQSRKHILDTIIDLNQQGMTVIYTSHYMEEVEYLCNRICIMDKGKIIAEGTKEELVELIQDEKQIHIKLAKTDNDIVNAINQIEDVKGVSMIENNLLVTIHKNRNAVKKIMGILHDIKTDIISIETHEPNLETVFLYLTGRALRD